MIFNFTTPYTPPVSNDLVFAFGEQGSFTSVIPLVVSTEVFAAAEGFSQFQAAIALSVAGPIFGLVGDQANIGFVLPVNTSMYGFSGNQLQIPVNMTIGVESNIEHTPIEGLVGYMEIGL